MSMAEPNVSAECRARADGPGQDATQAPAGSHGPAETQPPRSTPPRPGNGAVGILHEAAAIVGGSRMATHGAAEGSFAAIAADWTAYLATRREPVGPIRPHDVAHMMVRMKQQRAEWGQPLREHAVDAAGYSALAVALWGEGE